MPETTMQGVTLYTKARGKNSDVFELALTYEGIEIRRTGEPARHLSWNRITEWEIEQRRGGVLLTLRGGGSVTPLVIPRWKVDDLDVVLRDVTSHLAYEEPAPAEVPSAAIAAEPETASIPEPEPEPEPELAQVPEPEPEPEPEVAPEPTPAPVPVAALDLAQELDIELDLEADPLPTFEDIITEVFTPPGPERAQEPEKAAEGLDVGKDTDDDLAWPSRAPLGSMPDLQWPQAQTGSQGAAPIDADFMRDAEEPSLLSASATVVIDDDFVLPPIPSKVSTWIPAAEVGEPTVAVADRPLAVEVPPVVVTSDEGASAQSSTPPRAERRRNRQRIPAQSLTTVVLLGVLAVAVAMVLAQSAGAIHLGFLGPVG